MNKELYIQECYRQLFNYFELVKKKKLMELRDFESKDL
jgi:hypothetical protein